ncbi:MAG: glycosyltransferase, partial [Candidatus Bathyarchaeia archaeon]
MLSSPLLIDKDEVEYPFVSIIIATRNEEKHIAQLLDSLVAQTYPKDKFEVLIFDGMSEDATLQIVEKYRNLLNLRIFKNPRIKQVFAFNRGIDEAKGNLFMIVSAHSVLKKDFIEKDVCTFLQIRAIEPKLAGVGGILINVHKNVFGKIIGLMYYSPF